MRNFAAHQIFFAPSGASVPSLSLRENICYLTKNLPSFLDLFPSEISLILLQWHFRCPLFFLFFQYAQVLTCTTLFFTFILKKYETESCEMSSQGKDRNFFSQSAEGFLSASRQISCKICMYIHCMQVVHFLLQKELTEPFTWAYIHRYFALFLSQA